MQEMALAEERLLRDCFSLVKLLSDGNEDLKIYLEKLPGVWIKLFGFGEFESMLRLKKVLAWLYNADIKGNLLWGIIKRFHVFTKDFQGNQFAASIWGLYSRNSFNQDILSLLINVSHNPNETPEDIHAELLRIL